MGALDLMAGRAFELTTLLVAAVRILWKSGRSARWTDLLSLRLLDWTNR